jgi:membrane-associated protein
VGVVLPGETLVLLAAALAGRGLLDPVALTVSVVLGAITGDSLGYALGHWYEHRSSAQWWRRRIRPGGRTGRASDFLVRRGGTAVFTGRFIGFVRSFLPFAAGALGLPYRKFLPYSAAASLLWGTGSVLAGYFLGSSAESLLSAIGVAGAIGVAAAAALAAAVLFVRRNRRRGREAESAEAESAEALSPEAVRQLSRTT